VPKGEARLRITLMSRHTKEQIKLLVDTLADLFKKVK
jgi:7-keto-8-aminopelargonate synthetase-like enzyme